MKKHTYDNGSGGRSKSLAAEYYKLLKTRIGCGCIAPNKCEKCEEQTARLFKSGFTQEEIDRFKADAKEDRKRFMEWANRHLSK